MTYGWNTTKTETGYAWTVYSFTYGVGQHIIHSGICKTRAQAMGQAKRHVLPLRRANDLMRNSNYVGSPEHY